MGHRILLADDSLTIQKVVELTFSETDYELMAVGSGDRAVEALEEFRPDIVLADVVMPGLTGYEVCAAVKKRPDGAAIPVILLTGTFEPFDRARAESVGCDSIVTKPFDSHALSSLVEQLIAKGAEIRAALSVAPPPVPPPVPPIQALWPPAPPAPVQDPFTDTVAFRLPTPVERTLNEPPPIPEDVFGTAVLEEPVLPVEEVKSPAPAEAFELAVTVEPAEPAAAPAAPLTTSSAADEDTHPLLVIAPPPPADEEPSDVQELEDMQPRDLERDLEAFEQSGKGRSRPEVWDQAEALGVVSRVETGGEHTAVERIVPASRETGDLEALAAQASVTDLSHLIPVTREPALAPATARGLTDAEVERIARRVIEMIGEKILRDIAWDVVPEMADRAVRERLAEVEKG
jgi:CheY-like chemotaxis protein